MYDVCSYIGQEIYTLNLLITILATQITNHGTVLFLSCMAEALEEMISHVIMFVVHVPDIPKVAFQCYQLYKSSSKQPCISSYDIIMTLH